MKKFLLITSLLSTVLSAHICDLKNCSKLADSLITADSRGWYWNRYDRGSATLIKKYSERNGQEKFKVSFTFNGGRQGWAKIVLTRDGDFVCITYFNYPNTCRELRGSYKKSVQSNTKDGSEKTASIKIKYSGFTKWNGHHNYSLYKDGEYDGMIVYHKKGDDYNIFSSGVKHGQSVNGGYYLNINQLYTPQCGYARNIYSIDEAIKKAVSCIYNHSY